MTDEIKTAIQRLSGQPYQDSYATNGQHREAA
jgi:hypothetical protein